MAALKVMRSLVTSGRHQTETRGKPRHEEMGFGLQGFHEGVVSGFQHAYIESFTKIGYVWQEIVGVCKDLRWDTGCSWIFVVCLQSFAMVKFPLI